MPLRRNRFENLSPFALQHDPAEPGPTHRVVTNRPDPGESGYGLFLKAPG